MCGGAISDAHHLPSKQGRVARGAARPSTYLVFPAQRRRRTLWDTWVVATQCLVGEGGLALGLFLRLFTLAVILSRGAKGPAAGKTKEAKMKAATAKKGIKKKVREHKELIKDSLTWLCFVVALEHSI